jgi:hypothetical protein
MREEHTADRPRFALLVSLLALSAAGLLLLLGLQARSCGSHARISLGDGSWVLSLQPDPAVGQVPTACMGLWKGSLRAAAKPPAASPNGPESRTELPLAGASIQKSPLPVLAKRGK